MSRSNGLSSAVRPVKSSAASRYAGWTRHVPGTPFDLGGLAGVTDVGALAGHDGAGGARDAEGGEAALVAVGEGLLERERRQAGRIDAVRQVEVALAAL